MIRKIIERIDAAFWLITISDRIIVALVLLPILALIEFTILCSDLIFDSIAKLYRKTISFFKK